MAIGDSIVRILKRVKINASEDADGRTYSAATTVLRVAMICDEINETVQPRALSFRIGDGSVLAMEVGGRRLLRIVSVKPEILSFGAELALLDRDDARIEAQIKDMAILLNRFAAQTGPLGVGSQPASGAESRSVGFTSQEVRDACSKNLDQALSSIGTLVQDASLATRTKPVETIMPRAAPSKVERSEEERTRSPRAASTESRAAEKLDDNRLAVASKPTPSKQAAATGPNTADQTLFDLLSNHTQVLMAISSDGKILDSRFSSPTLNDEWLSSGSIFASELETWVQATRDAVDTKQVVVLKEAGLEKQAVAFFRVSDVMIFAAFNNSDLARVLGAINKVMAPGPG